MTFPHQFTDTISFLDKEFEFRSDSQLYFLTVAYVPSPFPLNNRYCFSNLHVILQCSITHPSDVY
jgi:hypothetical protein